MIVHGIEAGAQGACVLLSRGLSGLARYESQDELCRLGLVSPTAEDGMTCSPKALSMAGATFKVAALIGELLG